MDDDRERFVRWAFDELDQRITRLETERPPWVFGLHQAVAERRATVVKLRESGLSLGQIAAALGAAVATVERDLQVTPHTPPAFVLGLDGKKHPATKHAPRRISNPVANSENGHRAES